MSIHAGKQFRAPTSVPHLKERIDGINPTGLRAQIGSSPAALQVPANTPLLDIYAENYIPLYLRAVNDFPAQVIPCCPLGTIDLGHYVRSYAGHSFVKPVRDIQLPPLIPVPGQHESLSLSLETYNTYFFTQLQNEFAALAQHLQTQCMYAAQFTVEGAGSRLYRFTIPGLRENSPRIDLSDIVRVRPFTGIVHSEFMGNIAKNWYAAGCPAQVQLLSGCFGLEFLGVVWGIDRGREQVVLQLEIDLDPQLHVANLIFSVQQHKCVPLYRSVSSVTDSIAEEWTGNSQVWLKAMLFPDSGDGNMQSTLSRGTFDLEWRDVLLNFEQKKAVDAIVKASYGTMPFLISGPPGTGKTKTIVETALQLLRNTGSQHSPHLLICAPSDPAADTIATRLSKHLAPSELFRLNSWTRSFAEVPSALLIHCYVEEDFFSLPDFQTIMAFKVVVTTCRDAEMLVQARLTNKSLAGLYKHVMAAFSPSSRKDYLHWTGLLLDEAAQATEPEALIPIHVVDPGALDAKAKKGKVPQLIMAGDEYQLGPQLSLKKSKLGNSLFRRIFERDVYSTHPLSRSNGLRPLTAAMLPMLRPAFCNLIRNYRSAPQILSMPSVLFYHDTLVPEVTKISPEVSSWAGWQPPNHWPILFQACFINDTVESILAGNGTGAGSLVNAMEANIALNTVQSLLNPHHHKPNSTSQPLHSIRPNEIMIMTPFAAQVNLLRRVFREAGLYDVNIGPLEVFQGLESRIVILCTTRTRLGPASNRSRFVQEDRSRGLGVIDEPKKFNVSLTRAKEGLIVIGNPGCLACSHDVNWIEFLEFCRRNGCIQGTPEWDCSSTVPYRVGRLEKALAYAAQLKAAGTSSRSIKGALPTSDAMVGELSMGPEEEEEEEEEEDGEEEYDAEQAASGVSKRDEETEDVYDLDPVAEMERAGCPPQ